MDERIIAGAMLDNDEQIEKHLRPSRISEYIGQKKVKENLQI